MKQLFLVLRLGVLVGLFVMYATSKVKIIFQCIEGQNQFDILPKIAAYPHFVSAEVTYVNAETSS